MSVCEITWDGYLHISRELADGYFPAGVCVASSDGAELALIPLHSADNGGLMFKWRNARGDRSLLVNEVLGFEPVPGRFPVRWDAERGAVLIALGRVAGRDVPRTLAPDGSEREDAVTAAGVEVTDERPDGQDRNRAGTGPVGRVAAHDRRRRSGPAAAVGASLAAGRAGGRDVGAAGREPPPATAWTGRGPR